MRAIALAVVLALQACLACQGDAPAPAAPAALAVPAIDDATELARHVRDQDVVATLCIDQPDAMNRVTAALRRDGWTEIRTRNERGGIGIAATRDGVRFSATTGRDVRCAGTLVIATVMRLAPVSRPST